MNRFHYLARGLIRHRDSILVVREIGQNFTFLPGGHIGLGEPAKAALAREIREETGIEVEIGAFIGAVEASWRSGEVDHAEINLVFEVHLPSGLAGARVPSKEPHLEFLWIPTSDVHVYNLLPTPMRELAALPTDMANGRGVAFWGSELEQA